MRLTNGPRHKPADYVAAEPALFEVKRQYRARRISWQQAQTIKGQALSGDLYGAKKGLMKLVSEGGADACENTRSG